LYQFLQFDLIVVNCGSKSARRETRRKIAIPRCSLIRPASLRCISSSSLSQLHVYEAIECQSRNARVVTRRHRSSSTQDSFKFPKVAHLRYPIGTGRTTVTELLYLKHSRVGIRSESLHLMHSGPYVRLFHLSAI